MRNTCFMSYLKTEEVNTNSNNDIFVAVCIDGRLRGNKLKAVISRLDKKFNSSFAKIDKFSFNWLVKKSFNDSVDDGYRELKIYRKDIDWLMVNSVL